MFKSIFFLMFTVACCSAFQTASSDLKSSRQINSLSRSAHRSQSTSLQMYDKVFVAGAARGVGRLVVEKLSAEGKNVVAFVRREEAKQELEQLPGVSAVVGDALEQKVVETAMDGCDCAITTLGTTPTDEVKHKVDYTGNVNVFESAGILGVTRMILVTSLGCGNSKEAISEEFYELLKGALQAKTKAEKALTRYYTNSDWTVIRPGGLLDKSATSKGVLTENTKVGGVIAREDVADLIVKVIDSKESIRKVFTALDFSQQEIEETEEIEVLSL